MLTQSVLSQQRINIPEKKRKKVSLSNVVITQQRVRSFPMIRKKNGQKFTPEIVIID